MIYFLIIVAGIGIYFYFSKEIDRKAESGYYDNNYIDTTEDYRDDEVPENDSSNSDYDENEKLKFEIERLRKENEDLKEGKN